MAPRYQPRFAGDPVLFVLLEPPVYYVHKRLTWELAKERVVILHVNLDHFAIDRISLESCTSSNKSKIGFLCEG